MQQVKPWSHLHLYRMWICSSQCGLWLCLSSESQELLGLMHCQYVVV